MGASPVSPQEDKDVFLRVQLKEAASMRVNTNTGAINSWRSLYRNDLAMGKSLEKLSSGLRINRSSDDAGGLAISETLRAQQRGMAQAEKNAQDSIGLLNIADSTLDQVHGILQRMRELAVQASNGTLQDTPDRAALNTEFTTLRGEIDRLSSVATFNGVTIFTGAVTTMQVGANNSANDRILITIAITNSTSLSINGNSLTSIGNANTAIDAVNTAINTVSTQRATIGATVNRMEYTINNLQTTRENLAAAESRIRDVDMASEMTTLTRNQILVQSSTAMLAQANARPQSVLALLR
jgi:flagellin